MPPHRLNRTFSPREQKHKTVFWFVYVFLIPRYRLKYVPWVCVCVCREHARDLSNPNRWVGRICISIAGIKHPSCIGSALMCWLVSRSYATFRTVRQRATSCSIGWFMCSKGDGKVGGTHKARWEKGDVKLSTPEWQKCIGAELESTIVWIGLFADTSTLESQCSQPLAPTILIEPRVRIHWCRLGAQLWRVCLPTQCGPPFLKICFKLLMWFACSLNKAYISQRKKDIWVSVCD